MIKLSTHEQKILNLIKENPEILIDPNARKQIADEHGMTEKTLRNRIGDLKRYGLINNQGVINEIDDFSDNNMQKNLLLLWTKRKFILKNIGFVTVVSIIIALLLPKWYTSQAIILSSDAGRFSLLSSLSPIPVADFGLSSLSEDINKFIAILNSRSVKSHMVKKFDLINRYDEKDIEYAMVAFEEKMEIEVTEEGTLKISVIDKDPLVAKKMVEELLIQLDNINQRLSMDKGRYNREFLERRLNQARFDLATAEVNLKDFQEETGIVDIVSQISAQYEAYGQIYIQETQRQLHEKEMQGRRQIQEMQAYGQLYNQEMIAYTELYSLKAQTEIQLNVSKATLNPNNPAIKRHEVMLNEQEKQLDLITSSLDKQLLDIILGLEKIEGKNLINELEYLPTMINNELEYLPTMINFDNFPELGMENARLIRALTIQNTLLELLLPQYETARLEETKNIPTLQIIDAPKVPINKSKPIRSLIVIASIIMGLVISIIYIFSEHYSSEFRKQLKNL
ncbi:MAG: Wzz/FepE/Etk N-terminal domain-containing protein [Alphaproteobacteria bacterium]|nr:Wzz/FepE/Etk N-terminal domain-containing protein [Alphaproteobacteria bacterium]